MVVNGTPEPPSGAEHKYIEQSIACNPYGQILHVFYRYCTTASFGECDCKAYIAIISPDHTQTEYLSKTWDCDYSPSGNFTEFTTICEISANPVTLRVGSWAKADTYYAELKVAKLYFTKASAYRSFGTIIG